MYTFFIYSNERYKMLFIVCNARNNYSFCDIESYLDYLSVKIESIW